MLQERIQRQDVIPGTTRLALETKIRSCSRGSLQGLNIEVGADRVRVAALAPSYFVRQLVEQAALHVLPADRLDLAIVVARS